MKKDNQTTLQLQKRWQKKFIFIILTILAVFWIKAYFYFDPDFGYRIRTGQMILKGIFPKTDPYTYTMPSFPYVEHAWIIAASWALLYPIIGQFGVSLIYAAFVTAALIISISRIQSDNFTFRPTKSQIQASFIVTPLVLAILQIIPYTGIRAQIVSWFFVSILVFVVTKDSLWSKYKYYLPIFFLLWANTHGSWLAGITILGISTIVKSIKERKIVFIDYLIGIACIAATLINPYGTGLWREVWLSVSDTKIRYRIMEWMPIFTSMNLGFIFFFPLSTLFVVKYKKNYTLEEITLFFFFLIQGVISKRHIPIWTIIALPMLIDGFIYLFREAKEIKLGKERFYKVYNIATITFTALTIFYSLFLLNDASHFSENYYYPHAGLEYIKENPTNGNLFATYGWGGYLILKYPEKKVFVDGRMPSWRWQSPNSKETNSAFDDYTNLVQGNLDITETFDKYDIDTLLLPTPGEKKDTLLKEIDNVITRIFEKFGKKAEEEFDFNQSVKENGWKEVYEDRVSTVYRK